MLPQLVPLELQRSHWYENDVGLLLHVPLEAVSVSPARSVPEIVGGDVFTGARLRRALGGPADEQCDRGNHRDQLPHRPSVADCVGFLCKSIQNAYAIIPERTRDRGGTMGHDLEDIARALVAPGKGILAADESDGTIKKRFDSIGVESTEDNRRAYRDMLFTTDGAADHVSGVILYDETIRQQALDGTPFPKLLERGRGHPGDQGRQGREAPRERPGRADHRGPRRPARAARRVPRLGARFTKWRAVITIGTGHPERVLPLDERARARPLRGALAGGRARPDRRARGADGRRPHDRDRVRRDLARRCTRSSPSCATSASSSRRCC